MKVRVVDGITIIDIEERLIGSRSIDLNNETKKQIEKFAEGEVKLILNLKKCNMIDIPGLGVIVASHTKTERHGGRVVLLGIHGNIKGLMAMMIKLLSIFDRYDDEEEAIASFG